MELVGEDDVPISQDTIVVTNNQWQKYTATLTEQDNGEGIHENIPYVWRKRRFGSYQFNATG